MKKLQNSTVQHHCIKLKLDRINFLHNNEYKHRLVQIQFYSFQKIFLHKDNESKTKATKNYGKMLNRVD